MKNKQLLLSLFLFLTGTAALAQTLNEEYPQRFKSGSDSISIVYSTYGGEPWTMNIYPTTSPGTNAYPGIVMYAYIGKDTLALPHKNFPFQQRTTVYVDTPKGEAKIVFRYNGIHNFFPDWYMDTNTGKTQTEIPEVYELANIIWTLAPISQSDTTLNRRGAYYERVKEHFSPYLDHPIFTELNRREGDYFDAYYDFRENSFSYRYLNDSIVKSDIYFYVMGENWDDHRSLFGDLLPLVQDFADQSGYRNFYAANQAYYQSQIERLDKLSPVKEMWVWLEKEFPGEAMQSYKTVFSPLIGGSHSTQQYGTFRPKDKSYFSEGVFFICGPEYLDRDPTLTETQKSGLSSGIVFTEIDHNYVNPTSNKYREEIDRIFGNKDYWNAPGQTHYDNPISVFNEYMTHSVFCLWVLERFDPETAALVINRREEMNAGRRGFIRFREFNRALIDIRKENPDKKVKDLYPLIIGWCAVQIQ